MSPSLLPAVWGAIKTGLRSARGSSPHARGKPSAFGIQSTSRGLIPACAGKTIKTSRVKIVSRAHPRMRGENCLRFRSSAATAGSSPHARGKHATKIDGSLGPGLIPACAGKTLILALCRSGCMGSSPHARGKRGEGVYLAPGAGLIPACAGKTGGLWADVDRI